MWISSLTVLTVLNSKPVMITGVQSVQTVGFNKLSTGYGVTLLLWCSVTSVRMGIHFSGIYSAAKGIRLMLSVYR